MSIGKLNRSLGINWFIWLAIFLFLLLCNILTPLIADDYVYMFSYADSTRIDGIFDIVRSMIGHAQKMNGRLVAHSLVQFFLMLPGWIFDILNAMVFVSMVRLITKISTGKGEKNNLLAVAVFCALWVYTPAFGQVYLWLDGACNYLWGIVFGFQFLLPYINFFVRDEHVNRKAVKVVFVVFSLFAGAYSESASAAFIFMAVLLLVLSAFYLHKKIKLYQIFAVVMACIGYVSIYLAPAQWENKSAEMTAHTLFSNIIRSIEMYEYFGTYLTIAFVILLAINLVSKTDRRQVLLALVLFGGSLCANFIMVMAVWYPGRSALAAVVLLIAATAVLVNGIFDNKHGKVIALSLMLLLLLVTPKQLLVGTEDIYSTYKEMHSNENYIYACKEAGNLDVSVPMVYAETKYSALRGLTYLDTTTSQTWPNKSMAKIYGVDTIIGVP